MSDSRTIYLKMQSLDTARQKLFEAFSDLGGRLETERVPASQSVGRVLAEPVYARLSAPNYHAAAMDGIAVSAETTFGASESNPKTLAVGSEAVFVNTGHVLPDSTNAVIMIEHVQILDDNQVEIEAPAFPWENVRRMGEDIVATELLFARHHRVTPYCIGALLAGGNYEVRVLKPPKILILPTGSELVSPESVPDHSQAVDPARLPSGRVIESNAHVLGKMAESAGACYVRHDIVSDDMTAIEAAVSEAATGDFDIILVVGGSSAGSEDYARWVIEALGQVFVHGVTIMPGKPTVIGKVKNKPVFGIPGYPVSAIIAFEQFVIPVISGMLHQPEPEPETLMAYPSKKLASKLGMDEFLRVKLGRVADKIVATPLPRGAGTITSITEADGIIRIPSDSEGIQEAEPVTTRLIKPRRAVEDTIVVVGSHDNTIDVLADMVRAKSARFTLSSSHVGSMGGLMAIKKGLCHFAGAHLLDTNDGSYNISYIQKFLPDIRVRILRLAEREQGLIVLPGNPKQIDGIDDLVRDDVAFINRQGGSGTRILLDYHLTQKGLARRAISGYENEEFTHMAVAVAVLGRTADTGLGINAAAKALNLDFVPVATESYDLIIPEAFSDSKRLNLIYDIIHSDEFAERVNAMGGYHTENTGRLIWKSP